MLPPLMDRTATPADRWLWLLLGGLVLGLLAAFWLVCQQQVRNAEMRHTSTRVERFAMDECLQSMRGATPIRCAERIDDVRGVAGYASR